MKDSQEVQEVRVPTTVKHLTQFYLDKYDMDFEIISVPDNIVIEGEEIKSDYFSLINTKTKEKINAVKGGYTISQNRDVMEMVLMGIRGFDDTLEVSTFANINGGRKTFIQLEIQGETFVPRPDGTHDVITRYITILDSNDGSSSLSIGIGDRTASCLNQFFYFYKAGELKFRHSASITDKIKAIPHLLKMAMAESFKMGELYKEFETVKVSRLLAQDALVTKLLGHNRLSEDIKGKALSNMTELYNNLDDQMNDKGDNLWGLHSGVTKWTTYTKQAPNRRVDPKNDKEYNPGRVESALSGTNYRVNQESLKFCIEHIKVMS
jgi:hypothetical protein